MDVGQLKYIPAIEIGDLLQFLLDLIEDLDECNQKLFMTE